MPTKIARMLLLAAAQVQNRTGCSVRRIGLPPRRLHPPTAHPQRAAFSRYSAHTPEGSPLEYDMFGTRAQFGSRVLGPTNQTQRPRPGACFAVRRLLMPRPSPHLRHPIHAAYP